MAQYKHSRLERLKLSDSEVNGRSFGGTMLAFIFALILMLVAAGIVSIGITFTTDSTPEIDTDTGNLILSDALVLDGPYSSHVTEGWTFVPNITPEMAEASLGIAEASGNGNSDGHWLSSVFTNHRPYAENVKISIKHKNTAVKTLSVKNIEFITSI